MRPSGERLGGLLPYLVLLVGVLIVSTAAILVRLAHNEGMPSLAIATWRLVFAVAILTPLGWRHARGEVRRLAVRDMLLALVAGLLLAVHIALWISSLAYTSVASATALVTTNPIWVGLASWLFLREPPSRATIFGIGLSLTGSLLILLSSLLVPGAMSNPFLGNLLALAGAVLVSGYMLFGRGLRRRLSVLAYVWLVYTSAAVALLFWMFVAGEALFGFALLGYLFVLLLAIGPQLLGHTALNWALGYLSATLVAVAILGEPIGSAALAWWLFGEGFEPIQLVGFVLLLVGIFVAAVNERPAAIDARAVQARGAPLQRERS